MRKRTIDFATEPYHESDDFSALVCGLFTDAMSGLQATGLRKFSIFTKSRCVCAACLLQSLEHPVVENFWLLIIMPTYLAN